MRKFVLLSIVAAAAVPAAFADSPPDSGAPALVAAVAAQPTSTGALLSAAIKAQPDQAADLCAGVAKAVPAQAAEIGRGVVAGLLASTPSAQEASPLAKLPSVVKAAVTAFSEVQPAGAVLNQTVETFLSAINAALSAAGLPEDAAAQYLAAAVAEAVAVVPDAHLDGALAAPVAPTVAVNPGIPAPPLAPPLAPPPPVSASLP